MMFVPPAAGIGILLFWVSLGFLLPGSAIIRWGGGFLLSTLLGGLILASVAPTRFSASSNVSDGAPAKPKAPAVEPAARAQEEAKCRSDLHCWGEKHMASAMVRCRPVVERLAKNNFEWTDGLLEPKFSHYRWRNQSTGEVTYIGDKIKFQNGFGAWTFYTYECDLDPAGESVTDVRAQPGRLPN
ncbi:MAG: hypothetical protein QM736_19695 [Vicinamibacterales bacterium]